jgi:transmembrane sensor
VKQKKMESRNAKLNKIAPRHIRVQAALWVTDLHGPDRDAPLEARVRRWIAEDPRHAAAFELATEAWQRSGNLPGYLPNVAPRLVATRSRPRVSPRALAGMVIFCAALISAVYFLRDGTLATGPAEQRTVELSDGTQVSLNANSRVLIQYNDRVRKVTLASGEALFNVTKHQQRPFVVVIGDRKVIALGTSFLVRREESAGSAFAVTLVEGRVAIEPISWPDVLPSDTVAGLKLLNPGERLRFAGDATEVRDSPSIDKVTAWQRGQLIFDDTSLSDAAAEFNRYGSNRITIESPAAGKLRVGGVFRIGDSASFAQAIANAHHLRIITRGRTVVLTDEPSDSRNK